MYAYVNGLNNHNLDTMLLQAINPEIAKYYSDAYNTLATLNSKLVKERWYI